MCDMRRVFSYGGSLLEIFLISVCVLERSWQLQAFCITLSWFWLKILVQWQMANFEWTWKVSELARLCDDFHTSIASTFFQTVSPSRRWSQTEFILFNLPLTTWELMIMISRQRGISKFCSIFCSVLGYLSPTLGLAVNNKLRKLVVKTRLVYHQIFLLLFSESLPSCFFLCLLHVF